MKAVRLLFIIFTMLILIWLYIVNVITYNEYTFVYSESKYYRALQYILQGLWVIITFFGWLPLIGIGVGLLMDIKISGEDFKEFVEDIKQHYGKGKTY